MIQIKLKTIFIHIPRNAGTSIRAKLNEYIDIVGRHNKHYSHVTYEYYKKHFEKEYNSFFKFAVIRNPYERIVSGWKRRQIINGESLDFEKWLFTLDSYGIEIFKTVLHDQLWWIGNYKKENIYLIRYENFQEGWDYVCKKLKIINNIRTLNQGVIKGAYKLFHTAKTKEITEKYYRRDLDEFGYKY